MDLLDITPTASQEWTPPPKTFFAPAGRDSRAACLDSAATIQAIPFLQQSLDAMPGLVMVLNGRRQIIAANKGLLALLKAKIGDVLERRPGEALGCVCVKEGPDGCGTARRCATCGAVGAIVESLEQDTAVQRECRILAESPEGVVPLDLRVTATAFAVAGEQAVFVAVEDISHVKHLAVLHRSFFHDVLNTAGCIRGYAQFLRDQELSERDVVEQLALLSDRLVEEIQSQRDLMYAEAGDLKPQPVPLTTRQVVDEIQSRYLRHSAAEKRGLVIGDVCRNALVADASLLLRILGNMVKNALEAAAPGECVTISCLDNGNDVTFAVHNPVVMPQEVQLQVFQRSFSTKGQPGRGIGTYSMKLLGERYLGGAVSFSSRCPEGTTFRLRLPRFPATNR